MAKKKIKDIIAELLEEILAENGYELYNVEFVKEVKDWFLRVYLDKLPLGDEEQYISIDDCEKVSRYLSEKMDEIDLIEQNYYLEVSSAGLDRTLLFEKDYTKFAGKEVELTLYKAIEGKKVYSGQLVGLINNNIVVRDVDGKNIELPFEAVAKTKLVVVF